MDANINGGSSDTAILFNKYVEPHMTYMEKKASMIKSVFFELLIVFLCRESDKKEWAKITKEALKRLF